MKTKSIAIIAAVALLPIAGFAQPSPTPPTPPVPPVPPKPSEWRDKMPKVPMIFLGVETSPVPAVVCEQLAMAKGFGLVVDYVVPDSPAAAAGVQQNDILKMLNDQILMEPSQLRKLLQSFSEGNNVTLTVLRKGQEQKITVKLAKKEMPQRHSFNWDPHHHSDWDFKLGDQDLGDLREHLAQMKEQLGDSGQGMMHDVVLSAQAAAQQIRDEAQRTRDRAQRVRDEAQRARDKAQRMGERARDEARRGGEQVRVTRTGDNGLTTTKIDLGKAQIVFSDDKGELRIERVDGKKVLTAKDPKGLLLFSGPVENGEDLDKVPAEVRQRYEKLRERDLPSIVSDDSDDGDDDDSSDMNGDEEDDAPSVEQVSICPQSFPRSIWAFRTVLI